MQLFGDGKITIMNPKVKQPPVELGSSMVVFPSEPLRFKVEAGASPGTAYVAGLQPIARYQVEVDDEEMWDGQSDSAGTLAVPVAAETKAGVRVTRAP
jgi:hypothetical protein